VNAVNLIGLIIAIPMAGYLIAALLFPEKF
jgi:K+-transporting ATPase KdpF subunit